jgi:4-amino-4-deoxy-L-arabinose transferase-like glycosyltransferase
LPPVFALPDYARGLSHKRPRVVAALGALVVVYLATRLWFISAFPYFSDEGLYAGYAYQGAHSTDKLFVSFTIGREPLFAWLAIPWIKLGANPLIAVRLVSVGAGLLTVGVVGLLGHQVGGRATGLVAAALCVVLPFFVVHDGIGIYEPLVTLIMASALSIQIQLARRPSLRWGGLLGLVLAAGALTKENTLPALALLPLSLLCFDWSQPEVRRRFVVWIEAVAIACAAFVAAKLLMRSSGYYADYVTAHKTGAVEARTLHEVLTDPFGPTVHGAWAVIRRPVFDYVTPPLIVAGAVGTIVLGRRSPRLVALLLAWIAVPFAAALLFATFPFPRHVMYVLPPAIVLVAYAAVVGTHWARRALPTRSAVAACTVVAALALAPAALFDARVLAHPDTAHYPGRDDGQYVTGYAAGPIWPDVADTLRTLGGGHRRIVVMTPWGSPDILRFLLNDDQRYAFVWSVRPPARRADYAIREAIPPFPDPAADQIMARSHFVLIRRYSRPRSESDVELYARR